MRARTTRATTTKSTSRDEHVDQLAKDAAAAVMRLFLEVVDRDDAVARDALASARVGVRALRGLAIDDDASTLRERDLVQAFAHLRRGSALVEALEVTRFYMKSVRAVSPPKDAQRTTRLRATEARAYVDELRRIGLDEMGERCIAIDIVVTELLGAGMPKARRPRGPETILARVLVLHRDGVLEQPLVAAMQDVIAKATRRHEARVARLADG